MLTDDTISDVVGEYSWFQRSNKLLIFFSLFFQKKNFILRIFKQYILILESLC